MPSWEDFKQAAGDAGDWLLEQARKGPPGSPGRATEAERNAYETGVRNAVTGATNFVEKVEEKGFVTTITDEFEEAADRALYDYSRSDTSAAVDKSLAKADAVLDQAKDALDKAAPRVLTLVDWLTKPWVLGGIAVLVGLAIAAPYVTPFLNAATSEKR